MKRLFLTTAVAIVAFLASTAQKSVYIPNEWKNRTDTLIYKESDPDNKYTWSKSRSIEGDNVIVFWDKYYGNTLPSKSPAAYRVDEQDLLRKCEAFYDLEINKLGFVNPTTSNLSKYKVMVLMNHTTEWVCFGGGYDYQVSALWLSPSTSKPVGHSVAHEVGHSFHYMCYSEHSGHKDSSTDNTGFHLQCGSGQAIWEQTAQWQAAQSYPELMYDQSIGVFRMSHNYAFSHEWHRYQSYWFHYFINQYYGDITTVAQVWNQPMTGQSQGNATDFNQALMALKGLDAKALYRLYYDYAAHLATWDIEACAPYREPYVGDFDYRCVEVGENTYQVALSSTPQSTGFNVVPLQVPEAGTEITTHFTAMRAGSELASGDPAEMMNGETQWGKTERTSYIIPTNYSRRGFRLGYVALMKDGTRRYFQQDSVYCTSNKEVTADVKMTLPEGTSRLWLIVSPAPSTYLQHKWTDKAENAEHWPYRFSLEGTRLGGRATVYQAPVDPILDGREVSDVTLTYDVYFPASSSTYPGVTFNVAGQAAAALGTAFQMNASDIAGKMQNYTASGPATGRIMFYPCHPTTGAIVKNASTANGYGHWFNAAGNVGAYASGYVYSEFEPSTLAFTLGQYPGKCKNGGSYTISQALVYKQSSTKTATARLVFRIHLDASQTSAELASIDYDDPTAGIVEAPRVGERNDLRDGGAVYDLQGRRLNGIGQRGLYIRNGKKTIVRQ